MHVNPRLKWNLHRQSQIAWTDDVVVCFQKVVGRGYEFTIVNGNELSDEDQLEIAAQVMDVIKLGSLH